MKRNSNVLIDETPLFVLPTLAKAIGLNEAIILQHIHFWLGIVEQGGDRSKFKDGRWWVSKTYTEWQTNFSWWSAQTIQRAIQRLENIDLLLSKQYGSSDHDQTKWYTIDYDVLDHSLYVWSFFQYPWEYERIEETPW